MRVVPRRKDTHDMFLGICSIDVVVVSFLVVAFYDFVTNLCPLRDQIKRHAQTSQKHTYTLFLIPRVSTLATRVLEEEGVLGEITVSSYNLQFIPLEDDVISLEYDDAFKEIWVVSLS